jgi:hypothetical protein
MFINDVRIKGIQNKKKKYICESNCYSRIRFMSSERKTLEVLFRDRFTRMRQLVTIGELSNDVETIGTGSMRVVANRISIPYGCAASF